MSSVERTGVRSLVYSAWHRPAAIQRHVGVTNAAMITCIDVDWCEYCCFCSEPVALIETVLSHGAPKPAKVTTRLAVKADVPAFSVAIETNPEDCIVMFRVRQLAPTPSLVQVMPPDVYAWWLLSLRDAHRDSGSCSAQVSA